MTDDLLFTVAFFAFCAAGLLCLYTKNWVLALLSLGFALQALAWALPIVIR